MMMVVVVNDCDAHKMWSTMHRTNLAAKKAAPPPRTEKTTRRWSNIRLTFVRHQLPLSQSSSNTVVSHAWLTRLWTGMLRLVSDNNCGHATFGVVVVVIVLVVLVVVIYFIFFVLRMCTMSRLPWDFLSLWSPYEYDYDVVMVTALLLRNLHKYRAVVRPNSSALFWTFRLFQ